MQNSLAADELYRLKKDEIETVKETSIKLYNRTKQGALDELTGLPIVEKQLLPENPPQTPPDEGENASESGTEGSPPLPEEPGNEETESSTMDDGGTKNPPPSPESDLESNLQNQDTPDPPAESSAAASTQVGPDNGAGYTIQLAALRDQATARAMVAKLQQTGYPAYTIVQTDPEGTSWYRVRVGNFSSPEEGQEIFRKLQAAQYTPIISKY